MYVLQHFDKQQFLTRHWQKRPCVIKQVFADFDDPLDEHELAGLAQETDIDSRIIAQHKDNWQLTHGPFEDFSQVCNGNWTLLVQSVDRFVPEAKSLLDAFDFIPHWRKDDLMVSFSVPGAGVGPHLDQYDVFIIQGKGKRRWQVGEKGHFEERFATAGLRQVAPFDAIIDEVLETGDVIYIPPGFPHNGVALEECLNFSVGFRAPTQTELFSDFADYCLQQDSFSQRFADPDLILRDSPSNIHPQEVEKFRNLMLGALESRQFNQWIGQFLSKTNHIDESESHVEENINQQEVSSMLSQGVCFTPALHIKPLIMPTDDKNPHEVRFYIEGQEFIYPQEQRKNIELLLNSQFWPQKSTLSENECLFFNQLLTKLINAGFWHPA